MTPIKKNSFYFFVFIIYICFYIKERIRRLITSSLSDLKASSARKIIKA